MSDQSHSNNHQDNHWLDNMRNVRKLLIWFYVACAVLFLLDLFYHKHTILPFEGWFGFYGIYGFVACVLLVLAAKELRKWVSRPHDYYGDDEDGDDAGQER